jgi:hypothetical protein
MHIVKPNKIINQASTFFFTNPSIFHVSLHIKETTQSYFTYINPGIANIIKDPNNDPFSPSTLSNFVTEIATVTVALKIPTAVLLIIQYIKQIRQT